LIKLDQKAEILMRHFRDGDSQRKISDDLSISRTTVRKYIGQAKAKFSELEQLGRDE
jgi:DNA-binding CsgD family transcriptional regulator